MSSVDDYDRVSVGKFEIESRFGHHAASVEGPNPSAQLHADIRFEFVRLAGILDAVLPAGRAKTVAFTELETASMWAHKTLAEIQPIAKD